MEHSHTFGKHSRERALVWFYSIHVISFVALIVLAVNGGDSPFPMNSWASRFPFLIVFFFTIHPRPRQSDVLMFRKLFCFVLFLSLVEFATHLGFQLRGREKSKNIFFSPQYSLLISRYRAYPILYLFWTLNWIENGPFENFCERRIVTRWWSIGAALVCWNRDGFFNCYFNCIKALFCFEKRS